MPLPGRAYLYIGEGFWNESDDSDWELANIDGDGVHRFLGFRKVDDRRCKIWRVIDENHKHHIVAKEA